MPYQINNGTYLELTYDGLLDNQRMLTIIHYETIQTSPVMDGAAWLATTLNNIANEEPGLTASYLGAMSQDYVLSSIRLQAIYPIRYRFVIYTPAEETFGGGPTPALPPANAVALTRHGDGPAVKGGTSTLHMPGVPAAWAANGLVTAAGKTQYDALCTQLKAEITATMGVKLDPVIYKRGGPQFSPYVESATTELSIRTMKRRVVGRGI